MLVIAGKGGTGKTAISALLIKRLAEKGVVLAVDADPSTNLNQALGLPLEQTVGGTREKWTEETMKGAISPSVPKQELLEARIFEALVESKGVDLLAMGRPEGPGCYCASNNWLRAALDRITINYDYVVVDSEAGMEHISRQTTHDVDYLLLISDPTIRGITAAARTKELIAELRTQVGAIYLVVNRLRNGLPPQIKKSIDDFELQLIATIYEDPTIAELEVRGSPLTELPPNSPLQLGAREIVEKIGL